MVLDDILSTVAGDRRLIILHQKPVDRQLSHNMLVFVLMLMCIQNVWCSRPNIILIIADDLGWNDVSMHGSDQISTPNIDAMAYNGVSLNRHYVLPACTPSRAAILTGRYPIYTGMQGWPLRSGEPRGLPLEELTLPQRLQELGYVTRLVGKWHLGFHRSEYTPINRGFQSFFGFWNGYVGYHDFLAEMSGVPPEDEVLGYDLHRDGNISWAEAGHYATQVFTNEAVRLILEHDENEGPLFLQLAHLAVHSGRDSNLLEVPNVEDTNIRFSHITSTHRRLYAEMVRQLDESVGQVFEALEHRGLLHNTIIVFLSDNGAPTVGLHRNYGSNWPLRGMKHTLFEGGVRSVAAVWSQKLLDAGRTSDQLFHVVDWLPTLYSAAGGNVSFLENIDGIDQWETLMQGQRRGPRQELLLNVDLILNISGMVTAEEGGLWKLVKSIADDGKYDSHFGALELLSKVDYNIDSIAQSMAGRSISRLGLTQPLNKFLELRENGTVNCNGKESTEAMEGPLCSQPCLYNLITDPCEMMNIANERPDLVLKISSRLQEFANSAIPQLKVPVDPNSNPALHNHTWVSWLDEHHSNTGYLSTATPFIVLIAALKCLWLF